MSRQPLRMMMTCLSLWLTLISQPVSADTAPPAAKSAIENLGDNRYRVGAITIDKAKGQFSVGGTVIDLQRPNSPIEFIAVSKGGYKRYESIFELESSAVDFNLACILIGLDVSKAEQPKRHFDPQPLEGDGVELFISWEAAGKNHRVPIGDVVRMMEPNRAPDEWVYTGSFFAPDGKYMAEVSGSLIGFVHDPESIIQHRRGLGLGRYGSVISNPEVLPPPNTTIRLDVVRMGK